MRRLAIEEGPAGFAIAATESMQPEHRFQVPKHIGRLNAYLCELIEDDAYDYLFVSMPPRHGKSFLMSHYLPAWYLSKYPDGRVGLVGYEATFAQEWSQKARMEFKDTGARLFGRQVSSDSSAKKLWKVAGHRGFCAASGIGGPLTGRGFDLLLIDDPIKNQQEALSDTTRRSHWDWWASTASTRIEPGGKVCVTMTRWHEGDLQGLMIPALTEAGKRIKIVNLPALAEECDPLKREPGEALWPARYDEDWLQAKRTEIGSYWFNALYQGRPAPEEGNIFKRQWWQRYTEHTLPKSFDCVIISVDASFKETAKSDFVVIQVWGIAGKNFYLLDQWRNRADFIKTLDNVYDIAKKWKEYSVLLIEEKANGAAIISAIGDRLPGVVGVVPKESKEARAHAISPMVEAGDVWLPVDGLTPWVSDYIEEHAAFPNATHDDQVDTTSQALSYGRKFANAEPPKLRSRERRHTRTNRISMRR